MIRLPRSETRLQVSSVPSRSVFREKRMAGLATCVLKKEKGFRLCGSPGKVPPRGLETASVTRYFTNDLGQLAFPCGAESGAVPAELARLTPEALAAALMGLSPADRARLAALLVGQQGNDLSGEKGK
jgi:hypothetical protein